MSELPTYEVDCLGVQTPGELWRRYLAAVPAHDPGAFGHTLDSFWDAVQWQGPGWPGPCELVFRNAGALAGLKTLGGKPFLPALRRLASDTDAIAIRLE